MLNPNSLNRIIGGLGFPRVRIPVLGSALQIGLKYVLSSKTDGTTVLVFRRFLFIKTGNRGITN